MFIPVPKNNTLCAFDDNAQQLIGSDAKTILSEREFAVYPHIPTSDGMERFRSLVRQTPNLQSTEVHFRWHFEGGILKIVADLGPENDRLATRVPVGSWLEQDIFEGRSPTIKGFAESLCRQ